MEHICFRRKNCKAQELFREKPEIVSGEIAEGGSACDIEILQGAICECLLIKVIKKILNKFNKRVLLNERALNLEKLNAFKVETLIENVKGHIYVEGVTTT